eukprot:765653-Hanusia_phi.AAC.5
MIRRARHGDGTVPSDLGPSAGARPGGARSPETVRCRPSETVSDAVRSLMPRLHSLGVPTQDRALTV